MCCRDRREIAARIAAREDKKCIVEVASDSPDDASSEYVQKQPAASIPATNGTPRQHNAPNATPTNKSNSSSTAYHAQTNGDVLPLATATAATNGDVKAVATAPHDKPVTVECEVHDKPSSEHTSVTIATVLEDDAMKVEEMDNDAIEGHDADDTESKEDSGLGEDVKSKNGVINEGFVGQ